MEQQIHAKHAQLLEDRYGNQRKPQNIIWNTQTEGILSHHSTRNFLPDDLPAGAIETIVAAAQSASVSSNLHQWSVIVIDDPDIKKNLAQVTRSADGAEGNYYIEQAPVLLLWVADLSRNNTIAKSNKGEGKVHDFLDSFLMSSIDSALAAQNAAIAAESIGLGIVYIGAMRNQAEEIAKIVNLPDHAYITFGMVLGIPDPKFARTIRPRPVQEVVLHYNSYDAKRSLAELSSYEEAFQAFRAKGGLKEKNWINSVIDTADNFLYMSGRQNLRMAVEKRGFKLK